MPGSVRLLVLGCFPQPRLSRLRYGRIRFVSVDLTSFDISATGGRKRFALSGEPGLTPQALPRDSVVLRALNRRGGLCWRCGPPLVSVDSFGSLPASPDSPLGYRFPRSLTRPAGIVGLVCLLLQSSLRASSVPPPIPLGRP